MTCVAAALNVDVRLGRLSAERLPRRFRCGPRGSSQRRSEPTFAGARSAYRLKSKIESSVIGQNSLFLLFPLGEQGHQVCAAYGLHRQGAADEIAQQERQHRQPFHRAAGQEQKSRAADETAGEAQQRLL